MGEACGRRATDVTNSCQAGFLGLILGANHCHLSTPRSGGGRDDTLLQRLQQLIRHCLQAVSMEELHGILAKRINAPVPLQEYVEAEEFVDWDEA